MAINDSRGRVAEVGLQQFAFFLSANPCREILRLRQMFRRAHGIATEFKSARQSLMRIAQIKRLQIAAVRQADLSETDRFGRHSRAASGFVKPASNPPTYSSPRSLFAPASDRWKPDSARPFAGFLRPSVADFSINAQASLKQFAAKYWCAAATSNSGGFDNLISSDKSPLMGVCHSHTRSVRFMIPECLIVAQELACMARETHPERSRSTRTYPYRPSSRFVAE